MNYLSEIEFEKKNSVSEINNMQDYVCLDITDNNRRKSKKVEELIEKYSFEVYNTVINHNGVNWKDDDDDILLLSDFEELIADIRSTYISRNYRPLMCWLINRAFKIGAGVKSKTDVMDSNTSKNRALLIKTLYMVNPDVFMSCFVEKKCTTI